MISGHWGEPATFETQRLGQYLTIASAEEAARALLTDWPVQSGHAFMKAQKACLAVLEGRKTPADARAAFLNAAEETNVCVHDREMGSN